MFCSICHDTPSYNNKRGFILSGNFFTSDIRIKSIFSEISDSYKYFDTNSEILIVEAPSG